MLRNCDEDSGRSSCSAASLGVCPVIESYNETNIQPKKYPLSIHKVSSNSDLKVSSRPRSCTNLLKSPDERDPFPSCRTQRAKRNAVFHVFDTPRRGGLSNAHSTLEIASSTRIEQPTDVKTNAISLTTVQSVEDNRVLPKQAVTNNFRRGKPVQRAASRLYKADSLMKGDKGCVGPEFIVRASQPCRIVCLNQAMCVDNRKLEVVLLNGERIEVVCNPETTTAGQVFDVLAQSEKYEHNFMLGIAALVAGDFVFLPDEYKIKKVAPECWHKKKRPDVSFTVFLRIKFFLPTNIAKNIQGGDWMYRVYLQLRRATVEGQLTSTIQNLILLAGYALHIEFGEFTYREHGSADYFLLEHYLPEGVITEDMAEIKLRMKRAHESRRGLDKSKAIINYLILAQTFRDYGAHFYSAVWATRDGFCRDVWLSIGPRGVTLYSRNSSVSALPKCSENTHRIVLKSLPWHHIHTFYYNKKNLYIIPNGHSGLSKIGVKYKLKMTENKSYFTFWLASLHHRLYLKLYAKDDFITYLSDELCHNDEPKVTDECSNYQDSYNLAVRNPIRLRKQPKRRFKVDLFSEKKVTQNKENKKPDTEELLRQILTPPASDDSLLTTPIHQSHQGNLSNDGLSSSESCSLPRRRGVKMGTRVFNEMRKSRSPLYNSSNEMLQQSDIELATTQSDSDDLSTTGHRQSCNINSMKLLPERQYARNLSHGQTAFVIESPKVYKDAFAYNLNSNESCVSLSLFEKLDNMECVQGERVFVTAVLHRDQTNALGIQVAEGSDGNVYIKSITNGGPADLSKKLLPGDQIISVNGQTLLNIKYEKALLMLQSAPAKVELIVLQSAQRPNDDVRPRSKLLEDVEITDDELLNEEALKTIYALIKLTKDNVINRMKEKGGLNTPNRRMLQKCISDNKVYDESDVGDIGESSQETTPQKKDQKFNTWRGQLHNRPKRRPLSLSVPSDANLPDDFTESVLKKTSLNSIQSSLNGLDRNPGQTQPQHIVPMPRNFGLSRKWLGPVRYPVTPCKNTDSAIQETHVKRRFPYGAGNSDEDQIFL